MLENVSRRDFLKTVAVTGGMFAGGAVLAACGGGGAAPTQAPAAAGPVTLDIGSKGDAFEFDKTTLQAPAGSQVTVNLKNNAAAGSGIQHNWVLMRAGTVEAVAADGLTAGQSNNYVKPNDDRVIAATKLDNPGETTSVSFTAPAAGTYNYACTFPGHSVTMQGTFTTA